jgi:hypothetical protein
LSSSPDVTEDLARYKQVSQKWNNVTMNHASINAETPE